MAVLPAVISAAACLLVLSAVAKLLALRDFSSTVAFLSAKRPRLAMPISLSICAVQLVVGVWVVLRMRLLPLLALSVTWGILLLIQWRLKRDHPTRACYCYGRLASDTSTFLNTTTFHVVSFGICLMGTGVMAATHSLDLMSRVDRIQIAWCMAMLLLLSDSLTHALALWHTTTIQGGTPQ